jgi:hypothetical protein
MTAPVEPGIRRTDGGLHKAFTEGEFIPWKGLAFRVEKVEFDRLTLVPVGMTFKRFKEMEARKEGSHG